MATIRADLIGERTLGRAGVQKLVKLPEGRGAVADLRALPPPERQPIQGAGSSLTSPVDEPIVEFGPPAPDEGSDPRRRARSRAKAVNEAPRSSS